MMGSGVPSRALASLMARLCQSPLSCAFPIGGGAMFRASLAVALGLTAFLAGEPDPWFGRDKIMHLSVSFVLAGNGYADTTAFSKRASVRALSGAGIALSAGIGKELYDQYEGRGLS
jgi:uncharacterized protein YfiM (DUF2279 family)